METQKDNPPNFDGKCVMFFLRGKDRDTAHRLLSPRLERVEGREFFTGDIAPDPKYTWTQGAIGSVAWEEVDAYLVYDSFEEMMSAFEANEIAQAPSGGFLGWFRRR